MKIAVVIPVRNNRAGIESCLAALAGQELAAEHLPLEILVVDDGSTDGTGERAAALGARVIQSGGRGAAAARNAGVSATEADIVLFTDSDCRPSPRWAASLLAALEPAGVVAAKGTYQSEQRQSTARFVQREYEERYRRMAARESIDFLDTYSLAVKRRALVSIGGFDESLPGACVEDQEMSFRLLARGKFRFVPSALVTHAHADSFRQYARKKFRIGRGKGTLLRSYPGRARGDSHTPDGLRWQVLLLLACVPLSLAALAATILLPAIGGPEWLAPTGAYLLAAVGLFALSPCWLSGSLLAECWKAEGCFFMPAALAHVMLRGFALSAGLAAGAIRPIRSMRTAPAAARADRSAAGNKKIAWTEGWRGLAFLVTVDIVAILAAFACGYLLRFEWMLWPQPQVSAPRLEEYCRAWVLFSSVLVTCFYYSGMYSMKRVRDASDVLPPLCRALAGAFLGAFALGFLYRELDYSRLGLLYSAAIALPLLGGFRIAWEKYRRSLRARGFGLKRIVLVGSRSIPQYLARKLREDRAYGYEIAAVADQGAIDGSVFGEVPAGRLEDLITLVERTNAEEVLVAHPALGHHQLLQVIQVCEERALPVRVVPATYDLLVDLSDFEVVGGLPLVRVNEKKRDTAYAFCKRALDLTVSASLLVLSLPFLAILCAWIRIDSPGAALYRQRRVGRDGRPFWIYKLRSMVKDAEKRLAEVVDLNRLNEPVFKLKHDPRVTRVGAILRRYAIDELPQLWNVLRGEMSLVGPRPEEAAMVDRYDVWERRRLKTAPGMTGLQQIHCRGSNSLSERVQWDILYLRKQGMLLDLWILFKTVQVVLAGEECARESATPMGKRQDSASAGATPEQRAYELSHVEK